MVSFYVLYDKINFTDSISSLHVKVDQNSCGKTLQYNNAQQGRGFKYTHDLKREMGNARVWHTAEINQW